MGWCMAVSASVNALISAVSVTSPLRRSTAAEVDDTRIEQFRPWTAALFDRQPIEATPNAVFDTPKIALFRALLTSAHLMKLIRNAHSIE